MGMNNSFCAPLPGPPTVVASKVSDCARTGTPASSIKATTSLAHPFIDLLPHSAPPRQKDVHSLVGYRHEEHPEVSWLRNVDAGGNIDWYGVKRATDWHTDSTYEEVPPVLAMLHALEVPASKGGTMFADMRAAYDALPQTMKDRLAGLVGLHGRTDGPAGARLYDPEEEMRRTDKKYAEQRRPAVINHPVSGRPILFVNPMHTHGFAGMEREAAWQLIEELAAHATQERFTYYHSWQVGDLLIWDERATMHRGAGDYHPEERRVMLRTIVYPN